MSAVRQYRAALGSAALLLASLSCQMVAPPTPGDSAAPGAETELGPAGEEAAVDPQLTHSVLTHLLRYQRRSGLSEPELAQLARAVVRESQHHDLDPALVLAVMHVESRFNTYAVSPKDALGLMQLLPSTGAWLAPQVGVEWHGPQTLFDPIQNTRLGVAYLRLLVDRYDGDIRTALLAYNWGPGRIDRRLRRGTPLPREYAQLVFAAYSPGRS